MEIRHEISKAHDVDYVSPRLVPNIRSNIILCFVPMFKTVHIIRHEISKAHDGLQGPH